MKALQDLENAASGDAAVRQKIASLPQEVQDVSLLEKITGESLINGKSEICQTKHWKGTQYQHYHNKSNFISSVVLDAAIKAMCLNIKYTKILEMC